MPVFKYLDLGTDAMTLTDSKLLAQHSEEADDSDPNCPRVIPHAYGWWVNVQQDEDDDSPVTVLEGLGFSPSFVRAFKHAQKLECNWINFDQDGATDEELDHHDW